MSIIDKIAIGLNTKRSGNNLPFDCSTTANIGVIQPTMCREMAAKESLHVKVNSLVRLLALQNPTFGRMSLRHYHTFVPYNKLWRPFDAMMSNQPFPFTLPDGERSERYYSSTPTMSNSFITTLVMAFSDKSVALTTDPGTPIYPGARIKYNDSYQNVPIDASEFITWWNSFIIPLAEASSFPFQTYSLDPDNLYAYEECGSKKHGLGYNDLGVFNLGNFYSTVIELADPLTFNKLSPDLGLLRIYNSENAVITQENADFIYKAGPFIYYFKYKPILKKLRQIFMGLGYGFSPALSAQIVHNPFKLMAYYASCFELFHPKREISFTQTALYYVIENTLSPESFIPASQDGPDFSALQKAFSEFVFQDLPKMTYYLPMDYFSASVRSVVENNQNGETAKTVVSGSIGSLTQQNVREVSITSQQGQPLNTPAVDAGNPLAQRLALTLMRYVNKNTVIGRSIADYLRVHFGITDVLDELHTPVKRIGSSRININISDVMSTADTQLNPGSSAGSALGSYAGKGIGYGESETFDFTAETFGCWLTLSVIVPESGFYQGYLRENRHITRNDFFNEAYDALGYQVLERGEVSCDFTAASDITGEFNPARDFEVRRGFGFIPRYSEYKVGRNIVNGDLSLRSTQNSMASFTLDRRFPTERLDKSNRADANLNNEYFLDIKMPSYVPTFVYDGFRAIDQTDLVGNYNRIFSYTGNDFDHFIIHNVFEVRAVAPWKPLSSSFDTFDDEDNTSIKVNKA